MVSTAPKPVLFLVDGNADDFGALASALTARYSAEHEARNKKINPRQFYKMGW
jgi:hypothetical protein